MKALTYRWSGDCKTIIDIGSEWPLIDMALSIAIANIKKDEERLKVAIEEGNSLAQYRYEDCEKQIEQLRDLKDAIYKSTDNDYVDRDKAKEALGKWL